jgi:hypothetical protein
MALQIQLPLQAVQYIPTVNVFRAPFNTVVSGKYSFDTVAGNINQTVIPLEINSVYLIERTFISGNIPAEDFLSSVDESLGTAGLPYITLNREKNSVSQSVYKIPVIQFTQNRESPIIIYSDKQGDTLRMTMTGTLIQTANTIGFDPLMVCVSFSIYQINEKFFNQGMKMSLDADFGLSKRRSS